MPTSRKKTEKQKTGNQAVNPSLDPNLRYQIETRAYEIWLSSGGGHGDNVAHWLQAESEVLSKSPVPPGK
jgi:hypothetical protein